MITACMDNVYGRCFNADWRYQALGDRSVDTDTFARVHSNARTVHPLCGFSREDVQSEHCYVP